LSLVVRSLKVTGLSSIFTGEFLCTLIRSSNFRHAVKLVFVVQALPNFCNPDSDASTVDCNQLQCIRIPFIVSALAFQSFLHEWLPVSDYGKISLNTHYRSSSLGAHAALLTDYLAAMFDNRANSTGFPSHCAQ